ncbi:MAG: phosphotransferase, partial [Candidatus Nitrotoga sp.]
MTIVHNFSTLSPDSILNALDSVGLQTDGRLLALNSYENRVYLIGLEARQVGIEDSAPVVTKFYRPDRWTDAAILEEHSFLQELIEHEIPVVPPLAFDGKTLLEFEGFRYAVFPKHGGRAPELEDRKTLEWM